MAEKIANIVVYIKKSKPKSSKCLYSIVNCIVWKRIVILWCDDLYRGLNLLFFWGGGGGGLFY